MMPYLLNIFHHHPFDLCNLGLHLRKLTDLLWMIYTILHLLLLFGPILKNISSTGYLKKLQTRNTSQNAEVNYPNSLLRLLATAVAALPPPYLLVKSSLILSRNAIGTCLPADSTATTQYAASYIR